jgi:hypothetical protein
MLKGKESNTSFFIGVNLRGYYTTMSQKRDFRGPFQRITMKIVLG